MKTIELDEDLYNFIASQTKNIGESASDILRRMLNFEKKKSQHLIKQGHQYLSTEDNKLYLSEKSLLAEGQYSKYDRDQVLLDALEKKKIFLSGKVTERFMLVLSAIFIVDSDRFSKIEIKGRSRVYLSESKDLLLNSGKNTRPRENTSLYILGHNKYEFDKKKTDNSRDYV